MPNLVSFIIPAWNEEAVLAPTLDAITAAIRALSVPCEIVVADDASTDRTAEVARSHGARVVSVHNRQIAATRNAGAREARGDVLIFVDADTLVTVEAVRAALDVLHGGAVGGGCAVRFEGRLPFYARVTLALAVPLYRIAKLAAGCFLFCTREAFDAVGGFNTALYAAEECAMSLALRRHGRFVVLRDYVTTSGRKLRTFSAREVFGTLLRFAFGWRRALGTRQEIWYGDRRIDRG